MKIVAAFVRLMRPGDWAKNVFVVIPFVFWLAGDGRGEGSVLGQGLRTFAVVVAFSLVGGGFYAINDALDAEEDRKHPKKSRRPVASGLISPRAATIFGVVCVLGGLTLAGLVRPSVLVLLGVYALVQVLYNAKLKRVRLVDVTTVASGFVMRSMAGALAIGIAVSIWLVVVVYALTLFLGFVKRLGDLRSVELARKGGAAVEWKPRAGYDSAEDLNWLLAVTGSVTMMAYLLYALSDHARGIFGVRASGFALLSPLVFIVIHRLYLRANVGKADSPVSAIVADHSASVATMLFGMGVLAVLYVPQVSSALGALFQ